MNCKRLTGHGQDEMLFHCDLCHKDSLLDTYDVLTAAGGLTCPLCGANAEYLTVANEEINLNFKLESGEAGPITRPVSEEYISAEQHKALVDQMIDNLAALFHRINESNELKITATESKLEEDKIVCEFTFPKWFYVDDLERRYKK
ncbi:hypothetical protein AAA431_11280 [Lactobacillus crispatus]|uniref:hypothetical protein n=1 Tax=Lactobacillus crispatus TaxID=47770 RepID=UPI0030F73691